MWGVLFLMFMPGATGVLGTVMTLATNPHLFVRGVVSTLPNGRVTLNVLLSERLYREFPTATEGDLSRLRARLVSEEPLAEIAQEMQLGELLLLGSGELKTGGFRRNLISFDAPSES